MIWTNKRKEEEEEKGEWNNNSKTSKETSELSKKESNYLNMYVKKKKLQRFAKICFSFSFFRANSLLKLERSFLRAGSQTAPF